MAVTAATFRRIALAFEEAVEGEHMNHPDFRAGGRIFATLHPERRSAMVRLTRTQQQAWLDRRPDALQPASGAWGRQGCTMIDLTVADRDDLTALLTDAWQDAMADKKRHKK